MEKMDECENLTRTGTTTLSIQQERENGDASNVTFVRQRF